jgi:hypothetical protein
MNKLNISSQYKAITDSRYLVRQIEETNQKINSLETFSIFNLLKDFYLSDEEIACELKDKSFLQKVHFYLIGHTNLINEKIDQRIHFEKILKNSLLDKLAPLDPTASLQENITDVFAFKKQILHTLQSTNKVAKGVSITVSALALFWFSYNIKYTTTDYSLFCNPDSEFESVKEASMKSCPLNDPLHYFYELNTEFCALPILILAGIIAQQFNNEILSRFIFSPLDAVRKSAYLITERISSVKDFLLDKASDPSFKRPTFLKS